MDLRKSRQNAVEVLRFGGFRYPEKGEANGNI